MNFPHNDQNSEISAQQADALAMAGKILPGPGKRLVGRRQRRAITAASAALSIFDDGPAQPALSKIVPSGYTNLEFRRIRLVPIPSEFRSHAFAAAK